MNDALRPEGIEPGQATADFGIFRVLGNDVPVRHARGQTLRALDYILAREPAFPGARKIFVLNRLYDQDNREALIRRLQRAKCEYLEIPFDARAFAQDPSRRFEYLSNNNGARNFALSEGRRRFRWSLVLDGSCCLTEEGWREFVDGVGANPGAEYAVIGLLRSLPEASTFREQAHREEPQLAFSAASREVFDETLRYGNAPKAEMLAALGVPGPWSKWLPGGCRGRDFGLAPGKVVEAGFTFRLPSGNATAEKDISERNSSRQLGMRILTSNVYWWVDSAAYRSCVVAAAKSLFRLRRNLSWLRAK